MSFWKSRPKPTVTETDQEWLLYRIPELLYTFGPERLLALPTFTPNTKYFAHDFNGGEPDAEFVLEHVCRTMDTDRSNIDLVLFEDGSKELGNGLQLTTADRKGRFANAAGTYREYVEGRYRITIDTKCLANVQGLIAIVAHEVAHVKLLGERRLEPDEPEQELLTDLTVIVHGYGLLQGNSAFTFRQWQGASHQGWSTGRTGYLPLEVIGFALALLVAMKREVPDWTRYLEPNFAPQFNKNHAFILANMDLVDEALRRSNENWQGTEDE